MQYAADTEPETDEEDTAASGAAGAAKSAAKAKPRASAAPVKVARASGGSAPRKAVKAVKAVKSSAVSDGSSHSSDSDVDGYIDGYIGDLEVFAPYGDELTLSEIVALFQFRPSDDDYEVLTRPTLKRHSVSLREMMARTLSQKANAELLLGPLRDGLDAAIASMPEDCAVHSASGDNGALMTALGTDNMKMGDITTALLELVQHVSGHHGASVLYPFKLTFSMGINHVNAKNYEPGYSDWNTLGSDDSEDPFHIVVRSRGTDGRLHWAVASDELNCNGGCEDVCETLGGRWVALTEYLESVSWASPNFETARDAKDDLETAMLGLPKPYLFSGPVWSGPLGAGGAAGASGVSGAAAAAGAGAPSGGAGAAGALYSSLMSLLGPDVSAAAAPAPLYPGPVAEPVVSSGESSPAAGAGAMRAPDAPTKKPRRVAPASAPAVMAAAPAELAPLPSLGPLFGEPELKSEPSSPLGAGAAVAFAAPPAPTGAPSALIQALVEPDAVMAEDERPQRMTIHGFLDDANLAHLFTSRSEALNAASVGSGAKPEWVFAVSTTQDIRTGDGVYLIIHRYNGIAIGTDADEMRELYLHMRDTGLDPLSMAYATVGSSSLQAGAGAGPSSSAAGAGGGSMAGNKRRREA